MATLDRKIEDIREYLITIEQTDGKWAVCVQYEPKWGAYPPEEGTPIKVYQDDNNDDTWWYVAEDGNVSISDIVDIIIETVQANKDAMKKLELFKLKEKELRDIFSDARTPLSKLEKLTFVFSDEIGPTGKSGKRVSVPKAENMPKRKPVVKAEETSSDKEVGVVTAEEKKEAIIEESKPLEAVELKTKLPQDMTEEEINNLRG